MPSMLSYPRRLPSGHITCYLNRTYHVLTTVQSKSLDLSPTVRNAGDLNWGSFDVRLSTRTNLETSPNPFSALFDKLSHWFLKTLPASPLNPKTWPGPPPKGKNILGSVNL